MQPSTLQGPIPPATDPNASYDLFAAFTAPGVGGFLADAEAVFLLTQNLNNPVIAEPQVRNIFEHPGELD